MEKIKVNMSPNPLDVQTIHASQNDGEARQWKFELHNNGELIDTSEITEQLFFKAYKGGTEQLLPENGSTPTTSPFKGDIRYPQGLLTDQEFTYRQSPTEEDGLAKITDIKGQTLKWNQLVSNASGWASNNGTLSQSGNTYTYTVTALGDYDYQNRMQRAFPFVIPKGHKILLSCEFYYPRNTPILIYMIRAGASGTNRAISGTTVANQWTRIRGIQYDTSTEYGTYQLALNTIASTGFSVGDSVQVRNPMAIDLTMLFGEGNEPSTVEEFTSLFPLPYYSYNQGSLLSFNGSGIKTVGKNRFYYPYTATSQTLNGVECTIDTDGKITLNGTATSSFYINIFPNFPQNRVKQLKGTYTFGIGHTTIPNNFDVNLGVVINGVETSYGGQINRNNTKLTKEIPSDWEMFCNIRVLQGASFDHFVAEPMLNFGNEALAFEPYTSSTLSLPISTYFPSGMKDVPDYTNGGKIYDEMTSNKADTRVGSVDLGSLDWTLSSPSSHIFRGKLIGTNAKIPNASDLPNALLANYQPIAYNPISANENGYFALGYRSYDEVDVIVIIDNNYSTQESFISHVSGQYLFYELATPTETSFTTASLVTENAEILLSNEDGVLVGKCTEQLSENPGFIDAKIKLADADGTCYSNKLQLHVERSPQ